MAKLLRPNEKIALVRPGVDAHTLGISAVEQLLTDCGYQVHIADAQICAAADRPSNSECMERISTWMKERGITRLGFSYRLDPLDGVQKFGRLIHKLTEAGTFEEQGGLVRGIYFAGLPSACEMIRRDFGERFAVFYGDETPTETLMKLGVPENKIPRDVREDAAYDGLRMDIGSDLIKAGDWQNMPPVDRSGYSGYGTSKDRLEDRVDHSNAAGLLPLTRAHVGPYGQGREETVREFLSWAKELAKGGYLDILSIGTSQLTQSHFGKDWQDLPNGGGVPINSVDEYRAVWSAARPMLVRTYAGTTDIPQLAKMHEEAINICWHALSLWWFCKIDGRGPLGVRDNLAQHFAALRYIAASGKPFEPNIPHHFAFRGADDATYVLSAVLAARAAKALGIKCLVLQVMLNTPKYVWGIQDLARARVLLKLVRSLEDANFRVILQPRAGLDYFSHDLHKAKIQLAAVSCMMDDIEPDNFSSPSVIHVVSYSEASHLADPQVIQDSVKITHAAISRYRHLKKHDALNEAVNRTELKEREETLHHEVVTVLEAIERTVPDAYSDSGLYNIFKLGFLPTPYLWESRDEFRHAINWKTKLIKGSIKLIDSDGQTLPAWKRAEICIQNSRRVVTTS